MLQTHENEITMDSAFLLPCVFHLLVYASAKAMKCQQQQLGQTIILHCPPHHMPTFGYCCNDNGRVKCCTQHDFEQRKNYPSHETIHLIVITEAVCVVVVLVFCLIHYYRQGKEQGIEAPSIPQPTRPPPRRKANSAPLRTRAQMLRIPIQPQTFSMPIWRESEKRQNVTKIWHTSPSKRSIPTVTVTPPVSPTKRVIWSGLN